MTEPLFAQQLESPSATGRVDPEVNPASSAPPTTNGIPTSHTHSHWQICGRLRVAARLSERGGDAVPMS